MGKHGLQSYYIPTPFFSRLELIQSGSLFPAVTQAGLCAPRTHSPSPTPTSQSITLLHTLVGSSPATGSVSVGLSVSFIVLMPLPNSLVRIVVCICARRGSAWRYRTLV